MTAWYLGQGGGMRLGRMRQGRSWERAAALCRVVGCVCTETHAHAEGAARAMVTLGDTQLEAGPYVLSYGAIEFHGFSRSASGDTRVWVQRALEVPQRVRVGKRGEIWPDWATVVSPVSSR